jgi:exopolyphosphatase/pppGpp-phosphohydrolase
VPGSSADRPHRILRVAVIDVGSNAVRLLVASVKRRGLVRELDRDRVYLRLGDDAQRSETLLGGTLVLAEVARRLDAKFELGSGGLREGVALALAREQSVAA